MSTELRLRSRLSPTAMEERVGKLLTEDDYDVLLTGPARVLLPDGRPLAVYIPGAISQELRDVSYPILNQLKGSYTDNRGLAGGLPRVKKMASATRTRGMNVDSAIVGAWEASAAKQFCRLTAWTGREFDSWKSLWPLLKEIARLLEENVPERHAAQAKEAARTAPDWVIPGTPFTTVTVNHTWVTAVHQDKGDLDAGFSTLVCFREGDFEGGLLTFPEYRVAVDLQDRDLLLMDAHQWHGNTPFRPNPERDQNGRLRGDPGFERISVVSYFRTKMVGCADAVTEQERAAAFSEQRSGALIGE